MEANKESEPKVKFSKLSSRKTKIVVISIVAVVLLLGAVVAVSVYFALRKTTPTEPTPTRLAEVNLEEGETLTYKVDKRIEITGNNEQKATILAIVSIRVLNKTSEEYWFLIKFNLSYLGGDVDLGDVKTTTDYFLVRLQIDSRTPNNKTSESFEVYGQRHTHEELLRLVYGILKQLLPTVEHDLYEEVDGEKPSDSSSLDPEDSPLLPGSVQMHRKANTSDKNAVLIKNNFDRTDFVDGLPAEMDLELKYSDFATINKSNGMVTESRSHLAQQLNFGEPIHSNHSGGFNISMMKITLASHVSLIESNYFGFMQSNQVNFRFFVKLVVPKSKATFSVNEKPQRVSSNSTQMPLNISSPSRQRRSASTVPWKKAGSQNLNVEHSFTVFEKKVIGLNVKGEGMVWLEDGDDMEIGVSFGISIGGGKVRNIFHERYQRNQLEDGQDLSKEHHWSIGIHFSVPILILKVGVEFSLKVQVNIKLQFPSDENSLSPVKLAVMIEPSAAVTASIEGYLSAWIIRGGVYGDGTLVRLGLPVTLSYQAARSPGSEWCVNLSARLTALELSAGLFYQWRHWWKWGTRHTLYQFGKWAAIKRNWEELDRCG